MFETVVLKPKHVVCLHSIVIIYKPGNYAQIIHAHWCAESEITVSTILGIISDHSRNEGTGKASDYVVIVDSETLFKVDEEYKLLSYRRKNY